MSESGYKNPPKHSRFQKGCSETSKLSLRDEEILQQFLEQNKQENRND